MKEQAKYEAKAGATINDPTTNGRDFNQIC